MRIAHVITRLILGGAQENTLLTCEDLRNQYGDEVLLIAGPPLGPEGSLVDRCRAGGTALEIIPPLRRAIHPTRDLASLLAIRRALERFDPDVVHTHSGKAGLLGRVAARRLGVPAIVHTVHGAPFHPYQSAPARALFRACERYAARRCDAIVSVADAMTELLVGAGVAPREKFVTVYSGLEVEPLLESAALRAPWRARLGYADDEIVVGKVARLFHLKGHEYLIAAARQSVAQNAQLRFLLVGDGTLAEPIRRAVDAARLKPYFRFAGLVAPDEIPAYLAAMDLVVHVSLREGLARVLPQALLAGKPVVSYDVDGARELVVPGETGCLLPPRSVDELSQSILSLAADSALRDRLGAEGRRRCLPRFRHEAMTVQLRQLYQRVLASRAARDLASARHSR